MNRDELSKVTDADSAASNEIQEMTLQYRNEVVPIERVAKSVVVQCLLIAAHRGRQTYLAGKQATQLR